MLSRRVVVIGHRGVGKTSFLKRVEAYGRKESVRIYDLDREIEAAKGQKVSQIFKEGGEAKFRELERELFKKISGRSEASPVWIAVGGGFDPTMIPQEWTVLWLRRRTDELGRIFVDRPRLNPELDPIAEFRLRFNERQIHFQKCADLTLWLDEGIENHNEAEREFVLNQLSDLGGCLTLLASDFRAREKFQEFIAQRLKWGVRYFELRDDLLTTEQMSEALQLIPTDRALISFRAGERVQASRSLVERRKLNYDWALELGPCPWPDARFISTHTRAPGQSLAEALAVFPTTLGPETEFKAALETHDFTELATGDEWSRHASGKRIFLPRSTDGRWSWYRQLRRHDQSLGFFRETGEGSSLDQPTLLEWARTPRAEKFAAVLGDPVTHSRTPIFHEKYFSARGAAVLAICVKESEWQSAMSLLRKLGLCWAAVTSPLKTLAFASAQELKPEAARLGAVNTLFWRKHWIGTNTDLEGFRKALPDDLGSVAVWGGGGTLAMLREALPPADFYSAQTSLRRETQDLGVPPETLIWATPHSAQPPKAWRPKRVLDLNYVENSAGRAYAMACGASYISGLAMFQAQAKAQQKFWECEEESR